jgi:hypothetical protein
MKEEGRLSNVSLMFPNVEMRLDIKTEKKKPINIHLLFSPDDTNHVEEIERILSRLEFEFDGKTYSCTISGLQNLGKAFDPNQTDSQAATRIGANQFKITLEKLRALFRRDKWMQKNCLIAVSGSSNDGTSGLKEDDSFVAMRREIERFADIIFASTPSQRDFWIGNNPKHDRHYIEQTFGSLKPCLHGSDAHRDEKVGAPDLDRYCWIKGDLIFESLRQAVIEPAKRVWIGNTPPDHSSPPISISQIDLQETPWLANKTIQLNDGLIAIIGSRGSGKTALVDIIAAGAGAIRADFGESSFLKRASDPVDYIGSSGVTLSWSDNSTKNAPLLPDYFDEEAAGDICYLSQHFVERLCSSAGLAEDLRREMERVIFEATEPTERLETNSFEELLGVLLEPICRRREELRQSILDDSEAVIQEELLMDRLSSAKKDKETINNQLAASRKTLLSFLPKGKEERAKYLSEIEQVCLAVEGKVESYRRRLKSIEDLSAEIEHIRTTKEPSRLRDMQRRYQTAGLSENDWAVFEMIFKGDVNNVLSKKKEAVEKTIKLTNNGDPAAPIDKKNTPLANWPMTLLNSTKEAVKKEVGIDAIKQKKYDELQRTIKQYETSLRRLDEEIKKAEGAENRRAKLIETRREKYAQVFDTFIEEEKTLNQLYEPLRKEIARDTGALSKLAFVA